MIFLEVAVDAPLFHSLTYGTLPETGHLHPGTRVLAPLGGRWVTGYVLSCTGNAPPELSPGKIKNIVKILDPSPLFPEAMIPFFRWLAEYYHHPLGEVIRTALPAGLAPKSRKNLVLTEAGKQAFCLHEQAPSAIRPFAAALADKGRLSAAALREMTAAAPLKNCLGEWLAAGWVEFRQTGCKDLVRVKEEQVVELVSPDWSVPQGLKLSERKTLDELHRLTLEKGEQEVRRQELTRVYKGAGKALPRLYELGAVRLFNRQVYRDPCLSPGPAVLDARPETLSPEQQDACAAIESALAKNSFATFLLHGVTSSGKTEVYLRAAEKALEQGKTVLVLVPEIALSLQVEAQFFARFGGKVALLHSGLTSGERYDQWRRILDGTAMIVVGARSAVFAPLRHLGLVIVDEEHDPAYKQDEGLRYSGRDAAVMRASMAGGVAVLGSATPSVTSFHNAVTGKYHLLAMRQRARQQPMPAVHLVDLRAVPTISGRPPIFSPLLVRALKENIAAGDQALLLLNRRGLARMKVCAGCGETLCCKHCQVSLTVHRGNDELRCHYCGYQPRGGGVCNNCGATDFYSIGFGTQRVEEELKKILPRANIARLDRDTATDRKAFHAILTAMKNKEIDVLLGTQMVAKGHHFPGVTLVGVVLADTGLGLPDFRAAERTFQLLTQVTGRAGRGEKPGRVVIQTFRPDHYSVSLAQDHSYSDFFQKEKELREKLGFPPHGRMVTFLVSGRNEAKVRQAATELSRSAQAILAGAAGQSPGGVGLRGPPPPPLSRLKDRYRWQLVAMGRDGKLLHSLCRTIQEMRSRIIGSEVALHLDVDPENML